MLGLNLLPGFTNPLNIDNGLYKSLLELATAKIKMPNFSIRSAKNIGILEFSETYYRNLINLVGKLFINEIISLNDFIFHSLGSMNIADATYIKREGKKIHGAKKIKNYVNGVYETLQDVLFIVNRIYGLVFITDFRIINHNKKHLTKPEEIEGMIKSGEFKNTWFIFFFCLKSKLILEEARKTATKVVTRLGSNFVVVCFGIKIRKEDTLSNKKPIERTIGGKKYIIYQIKRCVWGKVVGNLFLVKGEGYDDFIPLFTTSLKSKPETIIIKYKERAQIEQTNKELKSDLNVEGNYYRKKESNHGYIFLVSLVHNIIQHIRLYFGNIKEMSFKDILNAVSMYLLWKTPPECVFEISEIVKDLSMDAEFS